MKTAIVYVTMHGTTKKLAEMIKGELIARTEGDADVSLFNLKKDGEPDLNEFDRVIIGGSVHAGGVQSVIKKFCKKHSAELLKKDLGLFLSGMNEPAYEKQFDKAFPESLRAHSKSNKTLGGEFLFEKMNFFQKFIVRKISGVSESVSKINEDKVAEFVSEIVSNG